MAVSMFHIVYKNKISPIIFLPRVSIISVVMSVMSILIYLYNGSYIHFPTVGEYDSNILSVLESSLGFFSSTKITTVLRKGNNISLENKLLNKKTLSSNTNPSLIGFGLFRRFITNPSVLLFFGISFISYVIKNYTTLNLNNINTDSLFIFSMV